MGASVKVFEVESGNLIRVLATGKAEITQVILSGEENKLFAFALDGYIYLWDWQEGSVLQSFRTKIPIHSAVFGPTSGQIFTTSHRLRGLSAGRFLPDPKRLFNYCGQKMTTIIYQINLNFTDGTFEMDQIFAVRGLSRLAVSPSGQELAFTAKAVLNFWRIGDESKALRSLRHSNVISRLAYHPRESCIVMGDVLGRIVMWYCLDSSVSNEQLMPQRTLHWHANEVTDLAFCNEAQYLVSGGEEAVMVLWQIESGVRQYLPRLGNPIYFIAVSGNDSWAAVSTRDNSIHLVSLTGGATLKVDRVISGISKATRTSKITRVANQATLLIPSTPGKVQLFDPIEDKIKGSLELAPQNYNSTFSTSPKDKHRPLDVVMTAVSACGSWMVSLEQRRGKDTKLAVLTARFKFWSLGKGGQATLLTIVDRPHRNLVTDLSIWIGLNGMPMAASASLDGTFKLWSIDSKFGMWSCVHVGSYHEMETGCSSISVSRDLSTLSATFGPSVTLWSLLPESFGYLKDVLTPSQSCLLKEARFVGEAGLVAVCLEQGVFAYNQVDDLFKLSWHAPVVPRAPIAVHPELAQFSMIFLNPEEEEGRASCVLAYSIESPLPIGYHFGNAADFVSIAYIPAPEAVRAVRREACEQFLVAAFDLNGEISLFASEIASRLDKKDFTRLLSASGNEVDNERILAAKAKAKALYEAIFDGKQVQVSENNMKHSMAELFAAVSQSSKEEMLLPLVASHALPPVSMLFSHYMKFALKRA